MREKSDRSGAGEQHVRDIRRATHRKYSSEEKIRIVVSGLRGEYSIAELCRREGIAEGLHYSWSKEFLEAGKKRLAGDTQRQPSSSEVKDLRREARDLKEVVAELTLENRLFKKSRSGMGATTNEIPRHKARSSGGRNRHSARTALRADLTFLIIQPLLTSERLTGRL